MNFIPLVFLYLRETVRIGTMKMEFLAVISYGMIPREIT